MATLTATVKSAHLISSAPSGIGDSTYGLRKVYLLSCDVAAYTGSTDNVKIVNVASTITGRTHSGKTETWQANAVQALCSYPGSDTAAQSVYAGTFAVSTNDLTFNLTDATGTELTSATASTNNGILVAVEEA